MSRWQTRHKHTVGLRGFREMADNPPVPVKEEKGEDMIPSHQAAWSPEYKEMFAFWSEERGDGVIREGDKIILKTAEGKLLFARARTGKKLKMGRSTYVADKLIGKPYGQSLEVARGDFNVVTDKKGEETEQRMYGMRVS
eukprot:936741-Amorphochlora_amoeboformis.AAC.1